MKITVDVESSPPSAEAHEAGRANRLLVLRRALELGALIAIAALLINAGRALLPFAVGLVLVYLLSPTVNALSKRLPRWAAILIVYAVMGLLIFAAWRLIVPPMIGQMQRLISATPGLIDALRRGIESALAFYDERVAGSLPGAVSSAIQSALDRAQENVSGYARTGVQFAFEELLRLVEVLRTLAELLIVPIWLFFVLNDQRKARISFNRLLNHKLRADFWNVWAIVDRLFSSYLRGQILLCGIITVMVGVGLALVRLIPGVKLDYIILLALWAGVAKFIPQFGSLLGGTPGVIVALVLGGVPSALAVLAVYFVADWCENSFLGPRIIGESVGIHPALLTVALVTLGSAFGFVGLLLAAPLTAIVRDLYLYAHRRLGNDSPEDAMQGLADARPEKQR